VELLDEVQIRAINMANSKNLPEVPTLMFEFIGTGNITCYINSYSTPCSYAGSLIRFI
jgi:hypothetical protein